jgi:hypothetical protein
MRLAWTDAEFAEFFTRSGTPVRRALVSVDSLQGGPSQTARRILVVHPDQWFSLRRGVVITLRRQISVRFGIDGWRLIDEVQAEYTGLGSFAATAGYDKAATGTAAGFTICWTNRRTNRAKFHDHSCSA